MNKQVGRISSFAIIADPQLSSTNSQVYSIKNDGEKTNIQV
jgi:hypothetical protein